MGPVAMKIVEIWANGYADETGLTVVRLEDDVDAAAYVRKNHGPYAAIASIRPVNHPRKEIISESYAKMMSRYDNS